MTVAGSLFSVWRNRIGTAVSMERVSKGSVVLVVGSDRYLFVHFVKKGGRLLPGRYCDAKARDACHAHAKWLLVSAGLR